MLDRETIVRWAEELCAFANNVPRDPMAEIFWADADLDTGLQCALPAEVRTPEQIAELRRTVRRRLTLLARSKKKYLDALRDEAEEWLDDPAVRSTDPSNFNLTPMDGVLSLSENGRVQVTPHFRSKDAKYAVTFAELIGPDAPARIRKCGFPGCKNFFVHVLKRRGRPFERCPWHHSDSPAGRTARTHKHRGKTGPQMRKLEVNRP